MKKFKEIFNAGQADFDATVWTPLQTAFGNATFMSNSLITKENVYFVLSNQFNERYVLWTQDEFIGYFRLQVLKGLENLTFSMSLWLDTTIETTIKDPTKRGMVKDNVLSGTTDSYSKANNFADIAAPIDTSTTIADSSQNKVDRNDKTTDTHFIRDIQNLYSAELSSRWNLFLNEFNWLFKKVFSFEGSVESNDIDIQAEIDEIKAKIDEIVAFANALNAQVQINKTDINDIKQEITTDIIPALTALNTGLQGLGDIVEAEAAQIDLLNVFKDDIENKKIQIDTAGTIQNLADYNDATNPIMTKNAITSGTTFTPTQANIYPTIAPMLIGSTEITITPNATNNTLTFTSTGASAPDTELRAKSVINSTATTDLITNTEPLITEAKVNAINQLLNTLDPKLDSEQDLQGLGGIIKNVNQDAGTGSHIDFEDSGRITLQVVQGQNFDIIADKVNMDAILDVGGNIITNVNDGVAPTDAVNKKQLDATGGFKTWKAIPNPTTFNYNLLNDGDPIKITVSGTGDFVNSITLTGVLQKNASTRLNGFYFTISGTDGLTWAQGEISNTGSLLTANITGAHRKSNGGQMSVQTLTVITTGCFAFTSAVI